MSVSDNKVLLSFDVEEFDMPREYGQEIDLKEQLATGNEGLETLMAIVGRYPVKGTFFTTANFANHYPGIIKTISDSHEIASHTYYHSQFENADLASSKLALEAITGKSVKGLRMPRMRHVEMKEVSKAGYSYDSSINPTWIPGRYNNRHLSRTPYVQEEMLRFPASVSPTFRIPLFWLSFKNFPYSLFLQLAKQTLKKDEYVCLYFHPWEFVNLDKYKIPGYTKRHAGPKLQDKLKRLIEDLGEVGSFETMDSYIANNVGKSF
jgi:hypothetical protein